MKIVDVVSEAFQWERPRLWNGSHFYGPGRLHKVTVFTDQGITGTGWNGGTAATRPQEFLPRYVDYYKPLILGRDPLETEALVTDLWEKQIKILGPAGLHNHALAALLIACWDIKGKVRNQSVHQMLGGTKNRVRAYIAGGYYAAGKGLIELQEEIRYNVEELKATAVKIKIGDPEAGFAEDMRRVAAARQAAGVDTLLMVDANCACNRESALQFARELENFDVHWFEEPLPIYDFEGYRWLNESTALRIATGENYYTASDFATLLKFNGAAVLNVDVAICPGYDVALEVASMAEKAGLTIAPHGCQELQLPLVAAVKNGEILEYYPTEVDPLRGEMFLPRLSLDEEGYVAVPDTPGIGFELNMELLTKYRIA